MQNKYLKKKVRLCERSECCSQIVNRIPDRAKEYIIEAYNDIAIGRNERLLFRTTAIPVIYDACESLATAAYASCGRLHV